MKLRTILLLLVVIGVALLVNSFMPRTLSVPQLPVVLSPPPAQPPPEMRIAVFRTGSMASRAFLSYRGGGLDARDFGMDVVMVQHTRGVLLFDAGFGREVTRHFSGEPAPMRALSRFELDPAGVLVDQLPAVGIDPSQLLGVVLTHAHWDHVSGLADLPGVPVWVNEDERRFVDEGGLATTLARALGPINYQIYRYESGPYWGFERSHDVFGDGSVVLVPAGGHTPGSTIAFINTPDGKRYALIGDLAWQREGVELPAERPWLVRTIVDVKPAQVREQLRHLHRLQQAAPDLLIVPAHDRRAMAQLPPPRLVSSAIQ